MAERGSGVVQELACSAALAQEYREVLTAGGLSEEEAAHTIHFHMGIGLHYFGNGQVQGSPDSLG